MPWVLDGLSVLLILSFALLGLWRGALRQLLVLGSILLAAVVGLVWTPRWGAHLAATLGLSRGVAGWLVAVVSLFYLVLVLGYGSDFLLPARLRPRLRGRLLGLLLGAFNGALTAAFFLHYTQQYLYARRPEVSPVLAGFLSPRLLSALGWFFLAPVALLSPAVFVAFVIRIVRFATEGIAPAERPAPTAPTAPAELPPAPLPAEPEPAPATPPADSTPAPTAPPSEPEPARPPASAEAPTPEPPREDEPPQKEEPEGT